MSPPRGPRGLRSLAPALLVALTACAPPGEDEGSLATVEDPGVHQWVEDLPPAVDRDWDAVVADDTLEALLTNNSTSYFLYRGEAMGYEFRALRAFAQAHGLELDTRIVRDRTELFRLLNRGEGDVVASRLVPIEAFGDAVDFTRSLYRTRPTVVQQVEPLDSSAIPEPLEELVDSATGGEEGDYRWMRLRARLVRRPRQLRGDTVTLPRGSEYFERVVELQDSIGGAIEVVELENVLSDESLVRKVAAGSVRLTVTPQNVAELTEEYFTNIAVRPDIGGRHPVAWAVRSNAPVLRDSLDAWIGRERDRELQELYETYFVDREAYRERVASEYLTSETGRLSEYDSLVAAHARDLGWDWRLLASQVFQESRFDPEARSWAGAMGLLQLMPSTAVEVDVQDPYDPEQNLEGAVRYLRWLEEAWADDVADPGRRLPFVLASYNAGRGHVLDARRLAEKHGDDPDSWEDVSYWLLQLAKRRYYRDPVVHFGYVRGLEPVTYVSLIRERFEHYKDFVTSSPRTDASAEDRP